MSVDNHKVKKIIEEQEAYRTIAKNMTALKQRQDDILEELEEREKILHQLVNKQENNLAELAQETEHTRLEDMQRISTTLEEGLNQISDKFAKNLTELSQETENTRLKDIEMITNTLEKGLNQISDKFANTFKEKYSPADAVTKQDLQNTINQLSKKIQPALNVAKNFKDAVDHAPCDNCGESVTIDMLTCDNCGGKIFWEI